MKISVNNRDRLIYKIMKKKINSFMKMMIMYNNNIINSNNSNKIQLKMIEDLANNNNKIIYNSNLIQKLFNSNCSQVLMICIRICNIIN